jgi:hypothetical protein
MKRRITFHCAVALAACSGEVASPTSPSGAPEANIVDPITGIADPGDDPAVVAIESAGTVVCAGSLIAPDVVLTARHCVLLRPPSSAAASSPSSSSCAASASEPLGDPATLGVLVGDQGIDALLRAKGRSVLVPAGCGADIAILLLDRTIDDIEPLVVRSTGVAQGAHVRTVGFEQEPGASITKVVRDHVDVVETDMTQFRLREAACEYGCGGPAIDESTAQIVGVLSGAGVPLAKGQGGAAIAAAGDIGTRADAFLALVTRALAEGAPAHGGAAATTEKTKKGPIDVGANCQSGINCAAGVCVANEARQYCSRTCRANDRCPALFRCEKTSGPDGAASACVAD